jgi:hypothetical protein
LPQVDPVSPDHERISELQYQEDAAGAQINIVSMNVSKSRSQIFLQNSAAAADDTASFDHAKGPNRNADAGSKSGRVAQHTAESLEYDSKPQDPKTHKKRNTTEQNTGRASRVSSATDAKAFDEEKLFEKYAVKTQINNIPFLRETENFTQ